VTTTRARRATVTAVQAGPRTRTVLLVAVIAGVVTLVIRLALHVAGFDLYGDEIIYTDLGRSVISGGFPTFEGGIFFLHGPGFFYLEAGWDHLVGGGRTDLMSWVYAMRELNAILAGFTAVVLVLLGKRISSLRAGAVAAALFALDPFCIRQNDRVLLETSMMLWVLLGYLVFMSLVPEGRSRHRFLRAIGSGLLFGCAVLTKDEAALITVFPLVVAAAFGWGPRRPMTLLTIATAAVVYGVYVIVVAANGYLSFFWAIKTYGLRRMLGLIQISGFNSAGGGDLWSRVVAEVGTFWTTYFALVLAVPMMLLVLRFGAARPRMMALIYTAAGITVAYSVGFGTLEEQELYLLVLPSLLIIPVAVEELSRRHGGHLRGVPAAAAIALLTAALGLNVITCVQWIRQPDDSFVRLYGYVTTHVPRGTVVASIEGDISTSYSLYGTYPVSFVATRADITTTHARYLVVQWGAIAQGYSELSTAQARQIVGRDRPVFSSWGRTYGELELYKLPAAARPVRSRHSRVRHRRHRSHTRKV
jgi:hypothetical protein